MRKYVVWTDTGLNIGMQFMPGEAPFGGKRPIPKDDEWLVDHYGTAVDVSHVVALISLPEDGELPR